MKAIILIIIIAFSLSIEKCYGHTSDTTAKKEVETKATDSIVKDNFNLGLLAGIGSHQGTRIGCYIDVYGFRLGSCTGYGVMAPLGFFGPLNGEYAMSLFFELPLKISRYINIGTSYTHIKGFDYHDDQSKYLSIYFNYERKLSRYFDFSFGFGIDELIYTTEQLGKYDGRESFHIDFKLIISLLKVKI